MEKHKLLFSIMGAILVALVPIVTAWGWTTVSYTFPITQLGTGKIGTITFVNQEFSDEKNKIIGVELWQIDLGSATLSDQVKIHVMLRDYEGIADALGEDLVLDISVWYQDDNATDILYDGTPVSQDVSTRHDMTDEQGNIVLVPAVAMQDTLYVIGRVMVPPDQIPPGLQQKLVDMAPELFCDLRTT